MATILITGANRGIGLELSKQYAAAGDTVIRTMRGHDRAEGAVGEIQPLDVTSDASAEQLAALLAGRPIDLLINNAGVMGPEAVHQSSENMDFPGFLATLDANVLGPLRVTQALLPNLRAAKDPKVAVISSRMGQISTSQSGFVAYRASKAAVNMVFKCLSLDLAGEGIAVAMLHPGWVRTDMGGAGADLDPSESAAGIRKVLAVLDMSATGRFIAWNGEALDW